MKIVLLCHPPALGSRSMPRFAKLLGEGMRKRGHEVRYETSPSLFGRVPGLPCDIRKWMGYIDQFLIFPLILQLNQLRTKTDLFVITDQALGMWVPLICDRPHVIHCHDFLALRSAQGEFPENPTGWTGRQYQKLIRKGFQKGRYFISVSRKTQSDLHRFLDKQPLVSEVIYNPLNYPFAPMEKHCALEQLIPRVKVSLVAGYLLHVGGNQWYKNREGVLLIYRQYCRRTKKPLPLLMGGQSPNENLRKLADACNEEGGVVEFCTDFDDREIHAAYAGASLLIFPSLEEGFGWPIIEGLACGTLVLTTDSAPMNEVGGEAVFYLRRRQHGEKAQDWANDGARMVLNILHLSNIDRELKVEKGLQRANLFDHDVCMENYETTYQKVVSNMNTTIKS